MLKMLRFDLYKIFKSKMVLSFFIITLFVTIIIAIPDYCMYSGNSHSVYDNIYEQANIFVSIVWLFVIPFAAKDFSSKFTKNFLVDFSVKDKIYYILSKIIYIFAFCVLFMLLQLIVEIIFNYAFGAGMIYGSIGYGGVFVPDSFSIGEFYLEYFFQTLCCGFLGTVYLFVCILLKKDYLVLVAIVPYCFILNTMLYGAINSAVGHGFQIEKYTVFYFVWFYHQKFNTAACIRDAYLTVIIYFLIFAASSILLFVKRKKI